MLEQYLLEYLSYVRTISAESLSYIRTVSLADRDNLTLNCLRLDLEISLPP